MSKPTHKPKRKRPAQAMVEFALALPILLMVMYGLIETGRLVFIYASVVSAARQAARYGSVTGDNGSGTPYYNDCAGIRGAAEKLQFLQRFSAINISYDKGPGNGSLSADCPVAVSGHPVNGDRIRVSVSAQFRPMLPFFPFTQRTITSSDFRTLLVGVSVPVDSPSVVLTPGSGAISISKSASPSSYDGPNKTITYTYIITNLGSDPITGIGLTDDKATLSCSAVADPLGPGATTSCTGTYVTTQADVDNGSLTNVAAAHGTAVGIPVVAETSLTINFIPKPALSLLKDGTAPAIIEAGELITYDFTLTNTGNVPLTAPFAIQDAKLGASWSCASATSPLPVGGITHCTGSYALKNTDISGGNVHNVATATAKYKTFTVTSNQATEDVPVPPLLLTISVSPTSLSALGQTLTYTYTVTNRTRKTVYNVTVTDTRGANKWACSNWSVIYSFFVNSKTCTRTATAAYTQADMDAGVINNRASAAAQGSAVSNFATATTTVTQTISLVLTKTANPTQATVLGTPVTYTYSLKNNGNVTLSPPFTLTDDKIAGVSCANITTTLAPNGGTASCSTKTYTITQADLDNGSIVNHATVSTVFNSQTRTSNQATATVITYLGARLGLTKSADPSYFSTVGQTITYSYQLRNTGNVDLNPGYAVNDNRVASVTCPSTGVLAVGGSITCTGTYVITSADSTLGSVTNTATATANGGAIANTGTLTMPSPATVTINKFSCDNVHLSHGPPTPLPNGAIVPWTIINTTGRDLHINSVTVYWAVVPPALQSVTLGAATIWTGTPSVINGGFTLPGGPWLLPQGSTVMTLTFSGVAINPRIVFTVSEAGCPSVDSSVVYPSG